MEHIQRSLYSFISAPISVVLLLLISTGFLLLDCGINSFPVESALGLEAGENTGKSDTMVTNFDPALLHEHQQQQQHQQEQLGSDVIVIPTIHTENFERTFPLESYYEFHRSSTTPQPSLLPQEAFAPSTSDAIPPDTVLPLVIESNTGSTIQNGGATDSNSVLSLTFEGLDETGNAVSGFQCRLDGLPSYYCIPPVTIDNKQAMSLFTTGVSPIQLGSNIHTFQVSAVDAAGNIDPTPASFEWSILKSIENEPLPPDTTAPDTRIVSANGGDSAAALNGSSSSLASSSTQLVSSLLATPSYIANTITFSFAGIDNSNLVTGYECASYFSSSPAEQTVFVPCTSPVTLNIPTEQLTTFAKSGNGKGNDNGINTTHTFLVRAKDAAGNVDSSPAAFEWNETMAMGIE
jgi:hypothetical protein